MTWLYDILSRSGLFVVGLVCFFELFVFLSRHLPSRIGVMSQSVDKIVPTKDEHSIIV